ncbi:hypothetical protein LXA43DRAFT_546833 [Ganoderma leucocontextum]|nr:hypothetical protein LXA43DRAFT_546833 [Ganoderma leucocontextum]
MALHPGGLDFEGILRYGKLKTGTHLKPSRYLFDMETHRSSVAPTLQIWRDCAFSEYRGPSFLTKAVFFPNLHPTTSTTTAFCLTFPKNQDHKAGPPNGSILFVWARMESNVPRGTLRNRSDSFIGARGERWERRTRIQHAAPESVCVHLWSRGQAINTTLIGRSCFSLADTRYGYDRGEHSYSTHTDRRLGSLTWNNMSMVEPFRDGSHLESGCAEEWVIRRLGSVADLRANDHPAGSTPTCKKVCFVAQEAAIHQSPALSLLGSGRWPRVNRKMAFIANTVRPMSTILLPAAGRRMAQGAMMIDGSHRLLGTRRDDSGNVEPLHIRLRVSADDHPLFYVVTM